MLDAWKFKTLHDSTFEAQDIVHKLIDVLYATTAAGVCVFSLSTHSSSSSFHIFSCAGAAIFLRPRKELEDLRSGHALGLSICLAVNVLVLGCEKLEIVFKHGLGRKHRVAAAHHHCKMGLLLEVMPRFLSLSAAVVCSAMAYYGDYDIHYWVVDVMFLASHIGGTLLPLFGYLAKLLPALPLPWNHQHVAHRYGEITMLLIGESILSMILVPAENVGRYFVAFACSLVTVQMLQVIHYSSEEFDPNYHALKRRVRAGRMWLQVNMVYGVSLIAFGVAIKALLGNVVCPSGSYASHRNLAVTIIYASSYSSSSYASSSSYSSSYESTDDEVIFCGPADLRYVRLLCGASIVTFLSRQVGIPLHEGLAQYLGRNNRDGRSTIVAINGLKLATILASIALCWDKGLLSHEVLLIMMAITICQGIAQTFENMVVHVRRVERGHRHHKNKRKEHQQSDLALTDTLRTDLSFSGQLASLAGAALHTFGSSPTNKASTKPDPLSKPYGEI
jgi:hypothetical protein